MGRIYKWTKREISEHRKSALAGAAAVGAAVWGLATGPIKSELDSLLNGPSERAAQITAVTVNEVGHFNTQTDPYWWAVRVRFEAKGLHGKTVRFVPWLYDDATQARLADVVGSEGREIVYAHLVNCLQRRVKVSGRTENALVRLNVPLPLSSTPATYYIGVAVFSGADELDYHISRRLLVSRSTLGRLDALYYSDEAKTALSASRRKELAPLPCQPKGKSG